MSILNIDETGITIAQKPNRIVAKKGTKQVTAITSAERDTFVTMIGAINAQRSSIPPLFISSHLRYQDHFVRDGPLDALKQEMRLIGRNMQNVLRNINAC